MPPLELDLDLSRLLAAPFRRIHSMPMESTIHLHVSDEADCSAQSPKVVVTVKKRK